jgi:hypothetical protein
MRLGIRELVDRPLGEEVERRRELPTATTYHQHGGYEVQFLNRCSQMDSGRRMGRQGCRINAAAPVALVTSMCERLRLPQLPCGPEGLLDPERKARLGTKWTCNECGVGFYDLGKNEAICPKCEAKQPAVAAIPGKKNGAVRKPNGNYRRPLRERAPEVPRE